MGATPVAVLSFLGFDGISTLAEDAKDPQKNVARATVLVCFIAGVLFILQTYLGQLIWPDYTTFTPIETAFSDIGRRIGGPFLAYLIALLVVGQAWASGITSQASASRLLYGMARDGRLPRVVFGYLHPKRRTPSHSILLMGGIAMVGALLLDLDKAAELVNFGACAGFMAVNLSVIGYYFVRLRRNWWTSLVSPTLGFLVCLWIWLSVSSLAMKVGAVWTLAGVAYLVLLMRRHGAQLGCRTRRSGSLLRGVAAVDHQASSGDKRCFVGGEEKNGVRHLFRCAIAIQKVERPFGRETLLEGHSGSFDISAQLRSVNASGGDRVDPDLMRREVHGEAAVESEQRGFAGVVGKACVPVR